MNNPRTIFKTIWQMDPPSTDPSCICAGNEPKVPCCWRNSAQLDDADYQDGLFELTKHIRYTLASEGQITSHDDPGFGLDSFNYIFVNVPLNTQHAVPAPSSSVMSDLRFEFIVALQPLHSPVCLSMSCLLYDLIPCRPARCGSVGCDGGCQFASAFYYFVLFRFHLLCPTSIM